MSEITGIDHFALWDDEIAANVSEYVVSHTSEAAAQFCTSLYSVSFLADFLRRQYESITPNGQTRRITEKDRAIEVLLNHPDWSDKQIAAEVPTTLKQLRKWSRYWALRSIQQSQDDS